MSHTHAPQSGSTSAAGAQVSRGTLDPLSPVVAARLRDEGVPQADIRAVATQLQHILPLATTTGGDVARIRLHPWVAELLARYPDKVASIFLTTRGKVSAR